MKSNSKILCTFLAITLGACAVDSMDSGEDFTDEPRLAANGLKPSALFAQGVISPATLTQTYVQSFIGNVDRQNVIGYILNCALTSAQSFTVTGFIPPFGPPTTVTITGQIGLAGSWMTSALTTAQQQAVSACVLARLNETGANVTISLRGNQAAYAKSGDESTYTIEEGAFFGNIFTSAYPVIACQGTGTAPSTRTCELNGHCSMTWAGMCSDVCVAGTDHMTSCTYGSTTYTTPATVYDL